MLTSKSAPDQEDTSTQRVPALPEDGGVKNKVDDGVEQPSRFSHAGRYDLLSNLEHDAQELSIDESTMMMPPFDSHFWVVYGNKLRVNGTQEGLCDVSGMN